MAVVTNGLQVYWNPKDGVKTGNVLANIAPGGATRAMDIIGAVYNATTQSLVLDGVDDYLGFTGAAPFNTKQAHTYEIVVETTSAPAGYWELFAGTMYGGLWIDSGGSDHWNEHYTGTTSDAYIANSTPYAGLTTPQKLHFLYRYDRAAQQIHVFINNVLVDTMTVGSTQNVSMTWGTGAVRLGGTLYDRGVPMRFRAFRYYNRALTDAEVAQNFNNAFEIGISPPQVKIAELRSSGELIPIYALSGHEGVEALRVMTSDGLGFIPLVLTTDANASKIRVQTSKGLRAFKK